MEIASPLRTQCGANGRDVDAVAGLEQERLDVARACGRGCGARRRGSGRARAAGRPGRRSARRSSPSCRGSAAAGSARDRSAPASTAFGRREEEEALALVLHPAVAAADEAPRPRRGSRRAAPCTPGPARCTRGPSTCCSCRCRERCPTAARRAPRAPPGSSRGWSARWRSMERRRQGVGQLGEPSSVSSGCSASEWPTGNGCRAKFSAKAPPSMSSGPPRISADETAMRWTPLCGELGLARSYSATTPLPTSTHDF